MATEIQKTITQYTLTPDPGEGLWFLDYDPVANIPVASKYTTGISIRTYPFIWGENIRNILLHPSAIALGRPPQPNSINLYKDAKSNGVLDQFNFSQQETVGVSMLHNPANLIRDWGVFPGVKLALLWISGYDWETAKQNYMELMADRKIDASDLIVELQHMVDGDTYPNQPIISQQQRDDFLTSINIDPI